MSLPKDARLPERRRPTHMLTLRVPLYIPEDELRDAGMLFDPFREALRLCIGLSRASWVGYICDDPEAEVVDVPPA